VGLVRFVRLTDFVLTVGFDERATLVFDLDCVAMRTSERVLLVTDFLESRLTLYRSLWFDRVVATLF
jgi:hypothetical protein